MTLKRKHLLGMAAVVVLLFVVATPLGDRHHGLGQHSQAVADLGQAIWVVALVSAAALIVVSILAAVQFTMRRRAAGVR